MEYVGSETGRGVSTQDVDHGSILEASFPENVGCHHRLLPASGREVAQANVMGRHKQNKIENLFQGLRAGGKGCGVRV